MLNNDDYKKTKNKLRGAGCKNGYFRYSNVSMMVVAMVFLGIHSSMTKRNKSLKCYPDHIWAFFRAIKGEKGKREIFIRIVR